MQRRDLFYIVIIGILAIILSITQCGRKGESEPDIYNYTTDTTYASKQYKKLFDRLEDLEEEVTKTPPRDVIYFPTPDPEEVTIEKVPDSILVYIEELEDSLRIAISDKFIKNYPTSSKLIDFELGHGEFNITTLNTNGETKSETTPLDLHVYQYFWNDNNLFRKEREKPYQPDKTNVWNQLYLNGGYDFFNQAPKAGLDYSIKLGRFRLMGEANTLFYPGDLKLEGTVKLGYRLLK